MGNREEVSLQDKTVLIKGIKYLWSKELISYNSSNFVSNITVGDFTVIYNHICNSICYYDVRLDSTIVYPVPCKDLEYAEFIVDYLIKAHNLEIPLKLLINHTV